MQLKPKGEKEERIVFLGTTSPLEVGEGRRGCSVLWNQIIWVPIPNMVYWSFPLRNLSNELKSNELNSAVVKNFQKT